LVPFDSLTKPAKTAKVPAVNCRRFIRFSFLYPAHKYEQ
jgi:hypothetical protein